MLSLLPILRGWDYNPDLPPPTERSVRIPKGIIRDIAIIKRPGYLMTFTAMIAGPGDGSGADFRVRVTRPLDFDTSPRELYVDYGYTAPGSFYKIYLDLYDTTKDQYVITLTCPWPGFPIGKQHLPVTIQIDTRAVTGTVTVRWWMLYIGIVDEVDFVRSIREVLSAEAASIARRI